MPRPVIRNLLLSTVFLAAIAAASWLLSLTHQPPLPQTNYLAADKSIGVTVDFLSSADSVPLENVVILLRENNLHWLRVPLRWRDIEPEPGQFDWTQLDALLVAVAQYNAAHSTEPPLQLIAVLGDAPSWALPPGASPTAPPLDLHNFGNFARALAKHAGDQLDFYQVWHEPNLSAGWGDGYVNPDDYAQLLREAALNLRAADPTAVILTAALAPTRENGPLNLNEMDFLAALYRANAAPWFDVVAGQPYGFDFAPNDPPDPDVLNFRRLELLRQVMLAHGDAATPIWATAAGYNALPADWTGRPSPWRDDQTRTDPPELQAQRTTEAIDYARQHWPWLGPLLAVRWDSRDLAPDDPARGFALADNPLLRDTFAEAAAAQDIATVGRYPATHPSGTYSPGWRTAQTLADAPATAPRTLTINFDGTRLALNINRGDYRGYLWVTVDGQPANALPHDSAGRSYVVLYDPQRQPAEVTLAQNLPPGQHQAIIEADGGWEQWPIAGWTVSNRTDWPPARAALLLAVLAAALSGVGLLWQFHPWGSFSRFTAEGAKFSKFFLSDLCVLCGEINTHIQDTAQIGLIFGLALAVYFAPDALAMALLLPLALALLARPDMALALVAFGLSFFQAPRQLLFGTISLTETPLLLALLGLGLRWLAAPRPKSRPNLQRLRSLDWAALALLILGLVSTLAAPNFGINMDAWRKLLLDAVVFYFLVRLALDFGPNAADSPQRWTWRLVDALAAGAVLHAGLALWGYVFGGQFVAAEGVNRALGPVYSSPNNLALFLERVLPLLLAVSLLPGESGRTRRGLYGLGASVVSVALLLTFSRGALLLGLPAALIVMALVFGLRFRRWRLRALLAGVGGTALLTALGASVRVLGETGFFRVKLWESSLAMLREAWALGIGPGNFLYLYRTRFILPEAWQEPNLSHPHNILLDFTVRLGLGSLLILGWLQLAFWRQAWRLYQRQPLPLLLGLMGSMAAGLAHGLIDNSYFLVDLAFIFFLTLGLVQGLAERLNRPTLS